MARRNDTSDDVTDDISQAVRSRAGDWLTTLYSGHASEADRQAFRAWIDADPAHARAYAEVEYVHRNLADVALAAGVGSAGPSHPPSPARTGARIADWLRRPGVPAGLGAAAVAVALAIMMMTEWRQESPRIATYQTRTAELRVIPLEDGSTVTLGARSGLTTTFAQDRRAATLQSGVAFFDIAGDPDRPFLVAAGGTVVRVIGTQFDVKRSNGNVRVSVLEGVVEVSKAEPDMARDTLPAAARAVTAGQTVLVSPRASVPEPSPVGPTTPGDWRTGRLVYKDARLAEIIADANRYHHTPIVLTDPDLADIRLTTAFHGDQIDGMLSVLAASQRIQVERTGGKLLLSSRAEPETGSN